jgi:3-oxoadipate enol-lactonase
VTPASSSSPAAARNPIETGELTTPDGVTIHWERRGHGEPLVILNNFFMVASHWRNFTTRLEQHYSVVNYDLRHQGGSSRVQGPISFADHVNDLEALLDHLRIASAHVLGTCISTLVARDFALRHPERVKSLVMVGPTLSPFGGTHRRSLLRSLMASLRYGGAEALFDHYYPLLYTERTLQSNRVTGYLAIKLSFIETNPDDQLEKHFQSSLGVDDDPVLLRNVTAPTLLLAGEDDCLTSTRSMRLLCDVLPNARCAFIEMAGHNPYFEATTEFEQQVGDFLRSVETADAIT